MKRLLCIVGKMDAGGAETFLMKIYRNLDKTKYQMDFIVAKNEKGYYDNEIEEMGGKIIQVTPKSKGILKNFLQIRKIVKDEKYTSVMRISQNSLSALELLAAKLGGAKNLVFRSSNSKAYGGKRAQIIHYMFRWMAILIPNIKVAPSTEAAEFMFGRRNVKNRNVLILKNAIDLKIFEFDKGKRHRKREELKINNKFVIGHIGRFNQQKNHEMLIKIFYELQKKKENAVLLLIGIGELESKIKEQVKQLNIQDKVYFLGIRKDIPELLMAMDVFVFPSFYEGMPNTVIEAQATGLQCYISNTITKEANITGRVNYISLETGIDKWVDIILKESKREEEKDTIIKKIINNGYDLDSTTKEFIKIVYNNS